MGDVSPAPAALLEALGEVWVVLHVLLDVHLRDLSSASWRWTHQTKREKDHICLVSKTETWRCPGQKQDTSKIKMSCPGLVVTPRELGPTLPHHKQKHPGSRQRQTLEVCWGGRGGDASRLGALAHRTVKQLLNPSQAGSLFLQHHVVSLH